MSFRPRDTDADVGTNFVIRTKTQKNTLRGLKRVMTACIACNQPLAAIEVIPKQVGGVPWMVIACSRSGTTDS